MGMRHRRQHALAGMTVGAILLAGCTAPATTSAGDTTSAPVPSVTSTLAMSATAANETAASESAANVTAASETAAGPTALTGSGPAPTLKNDLVGDSVSHKLGVDGESFGLRVDYWTTTPVSGWAVGGGQDLHLSAYLSPKGAAPQVLVDRVQVRWLLDSTVLGLNGVLQSELVDAPSGGGAGFVLSKVYPYSTVSEKNGVGQALLDRWAMLAPGQPFTEATVRAAGIYAVTLIVRFDMLVRSEGETASHRRTVVDHLNVPLPKS